jgi:hypothetical protein
VLAERAEDHLFLQGRLQMVGCDPYLAGFRCVDYHLYSWAYLLAYYWAPS